MNINLDQPVVGYDGSGATENGKPVTLGPWIAPHVAIGKGLETKDYVTAMVVAQKLHKGGKNAELAADEVRIIIAAVEHSEALTAWPKGLVKYLFDPASIPEAQREALDRLYKHAGNGKGG